jgi:hypothetical protein
MFKKCWTDTVGLLNGIAPMHGQSRHEADHAAVPHHAALWGGAAGCNSTVTHGFGGIGPA